MITQLADGDAVVRQRLVDAVIKGAIVIGAITAVVLGAVLIVRHLDR
jgi:hypothetical protein